MSRPRTRRLPGRRRSAASAAASRPVPWLSAAAISLLVSAVSLLRRCHQDAPVLSAVRTAQALGSG
jgi:hypothetical protein